MLPIDISAFAGTLINLIPLSFSNSYNCDDQFFIPDAIDQPVTRTPELYLVSIAQSL